MRTRCVVRVFLMKQILDYLESPRPAPVARLTARGARRSPVRGPSLRSAPRNDSLSFERATLSRDVARILRILAASGKSSISRTDERRIASFEPRSSLRCGACVTGRAKLSRARGAWRRERRASRSGRSALPTASCRGGKAATRASPFQSTRLPGDPPAVPGGLKGRAALGGAPIPQAARDRRSLGPLARQRRARTPQGATRPRRAARSL